MRFDLIDAVLERSPGAIVAVKQVTSAEEYLHDHFPKFQILPGVMMVETLAQAARRLLEDEGGAGERGVRYVLGTVRGVKFGQVVRTGQGLRVSVTLSGGPDERGAFEFRGSGTVVVPGQSEASERPAVSGRFTMRPIRPL